MTDITEYWLTHYVADVGLCSLCGNRGILDTRATAISAAGVSAGRLNYCLCPNGQTMRDHGAALFAAVAEAPPRTRNKTVV